MIIDDIDIAIPIVGGWLRLTGIDVSAAYADPDLLLQLRNNLVGNGYNISLDLLRRTLGDLRDAAAGRPSRAKPLHAAGLQKKWEKYSHKSRVGSAPRTVGSALSAGASATREITAADLAWRIIPVDPQIVASLAERHGAPPISELQLQISELRALLAERLLQIARANTTERQWTILELYLSGRYTQEQIGAIVGVCQTTIYKTLNGNDTYHPDGRVKRYGGLVKKLRKLASEDDTCREILQAITKMEEES